MRSRSSTSTWTGLVSGLFLFFVWWSLAARAGRLPAPSGAAQKVAAPKPRSTEAYRQNTLGVAYLSQQRPSDAQHHFEQALVADPGFAVARLNLGVSLLAQQKLEPAREALEKAVQALPGDRFAWYNLGLVLKDLGEAEKGIAAFRQVTAIAEEADAYYFIGYLSTQLQNYDQAIAAFEKGLELNPNHASSEFGIARAYQRRGGAAEARTHLARFQKITADHLGTPFGAAYGDQGRLSLAELPQSTALEAPREAPVHFERQPLVEPSPRASSRLLTPPLGPSAGACFFDYDGDGRPDLFLVSAAPGGQSRLLRNLGAGRFKEVTREAGIDLRGVGYGCAAGDFDSDNRTDLAVCMSDGVHLLRNRPGGSFEELTTAAGIRSGPGCVGLTFVDYDHDGDLDLLVTYSPDASGRRNVLWRNNGQSTFSDVSEESGLGGEASGAGIAATDFNNDRAIDFVLAGGKSGASILLNPREGKFAPLPAIDFEAEHLPPAVGVLSLDFDKDGWMDLAFTHSGKPGISLWRNRGGKRLERVPLPELGLLRGWGLAALDYDKDGWIDLVVAGESSAQAGLVLLRNLGPKGWADRTRETGLDRIQLNEPRAIAVADTGGKGAADLVVTQLGGEPVFLRPEGAEHQNWLEIDLKALGDNKNAIGTKVELYAGTLYQKWEVAGASGYLGQSSTSVLAGLGGESGAELVRLLWPTGVPQDEIGLPAGKVHNLAELDRRGSSCPILFAWNGREYEFIADMLGPGVVGHWIGPGQRDLPDPDEYLKVPASAVRPKQGLLRFRFMEPMEETVYLDQVRLLAVDHREGIEVYPNERFVSAPPFPEFKVIASRNARPPLGAWDDQGRDVLPLLAKSDRIYVTGFATLPFTGFAKPHWLELDLGSWEASAPLRLILDGYTDYFTATSMYAADQAGVKVQAPELEARDSSGKWIRVVDDLGFPAGLRRTMIADLTGKLPAGTRRVRIKTNLKIYWDAIRIDQTPESSQVRVSEAPLAGAELAFLGYPEEIRLAPASDTVYSYARRSTTGPYARAAGNYTRYGDVRELLKGSDDRFAVFGSGEGVEVRFDPRGLPRLDSGWVRDYFFYADGFEKDLDFYAAHAFTVEPLPRHSGLPYPYPAGREYPTDQVHLRYQLEYNTRQRSGRLPPSLRTRYGRGVGEPKAHSD